MHDGFLNLATMAPSNAKQRTYISSDYDAVSTTGLRSVRHETVSTRKVYDAVSTMYVGV